jgi:hypothetical protein
MVGAGLVLFALVAPPDDRRQYYDDKWEYQKERKYYFRTYYFKPEKDDKDYKRQYLIYKPQRTTAWVYWLNPDSQRIWARTATTEHPTLGEKVRKGQQQWSLLPREKRRDSLDAINDDDFGPVQEGPHTLARSKDKLAIDAPPRDLPRAEKKEP